MAETLGTKPFQGTSTIPSFPNALNAAAKSACRAAVSVCLRQLCGSPARNALGKAGALRVVGRAAVAEAIQALGCSLAVRARQHLPQITLQNPRQFCAPFAPSGPINPGLQQGMHALQEHDKRRSLQTMQG